MSTPVQEFPATGLAEAKRCVVLGLEGCALVLAQTEVLALESVLDLKRPARADGSADGAGAAQSLEGVRTAQALESVRTAHHVTGVLSLAGQDCPVYSLDADLNSVPVLPSRHRICAVLNHARGPYALSCCDVRMVDHTKLELHPLPRAFAARSGPLRALVVMEGRLLLGSTAAALLAHVAQPQQAEVISFDAHARKVRS
jgi:hypothetical protein